MGIRQNILNICGFVAIHAVLSILGNLKNRTLVQIPGDQGSHTRTQILRSVLEPTQFPVVMVCQDRYWIYHSELIIPDTLMQHPFWGKTKWACRARECGGRKILAWIPPQFLIARQLLIGPHHCPFITIKFRVQLSAIQTEMSPFGPNLILCFSLPHLHSSGCTNTPWSFTWRLKLSIFFRMLLKLI